MYVAPVESSVLPLAAREFLMLSPVTMAWDGFCSEVILNTRAAMVRLGLER